MGIRNASLFTAVLAWVCLVRAAAAADAAAPVTVERSAPPAAAQLPKVRAITGFVRLDPAHYAEEVAAALVVLHDAQREFQKRGYEVETIRIVTQPLAELVQGQTEPQALEFLAKARCRVGARRIHARRRPHDAAR